MPPTRLHESSADRPSAAAMLPHPVRSGNSDAPFTFNSARKRRLLNWSSSRSRTQHVMKTKILQLLVVAMLSLLIAGCATTLQVIDTNVPPITLDKAQQGHFYITDVVRFPAGTYTPDFKTKAGVFYRAPSKMVHSVMAGSFSRPRNGGLFVPFPEDKDQRLGVWFDNQGSSDLGLYSPTKVLRLRDPIEFVAQKETTK